MLTDAVVVVVTVVVVVVVVVAAPGVGTSMGLETKGELRGPGGRTRLAGAVTVVTVGRVSLFETATVGAALYAI